MSHDPRVMASFFSSLCGSCGRSYLSLMRRPWAASALNGIKLVKGSRLTVCARKLGE